MATIAPFWSAAGPALTIINAGADMRQGYGSLHTGRMVTSDVARELVGRRLRAQRIERGDVASDGATGLETTMRHVLALQAQDFPNAVWSLGLRAPGSTRSAVLGALASGAIVRSAPMRGTLHFLPAEDLRWMLDLTSARTLAAAATRFRQLGLDADQFDSAADVARDVLADGGLGRAEFFAALEAAGLSTAGQRGYHIIFQLSQRAVVCWGPPRGTQQALVLVDRWIAPTAPVERAEALGALALRYFTGHGPATLKDLAWWAKLTLADASAGIARVRDHLAALDHAGSEYWSVAGEQDAAASAPRPGMIYALPGFDEYLLGYADRSLVMSDAEMQVVVPGKNGIFLPVIVKAGRVAGTWRKTPEPTAAPFAPLSQRDRVAFERSARDFTRFWNA